MKSLKLSVIAFVAALLPVAATAQGTFELKNYSGKMIKSVKLYEGVSLKYFNALYLHGNTLYCGSGSSVYAFDVSSPMSPRFLSKVTMYGLVRQLTEQNGIVYVASREAGVFIIDATNPSDMKLVTRYDPIELATGIEVAGDVLFLGTRQNGVECVDVSDINNPKHIRIEKTSESQSVTYKDGYLYSGEWSGHKVTVIDARDMAALKTVTTVDIEGLGDGVWTCGNYLYASTGNEMADKDPSIPADVRKGGGHGLEVFDISNPQKPKFLSKTGFDVLYWPSNDYWTNRPFSDGQYVACADAGNGLYIVDVRKPKKPRTVSRVTFTYDGTHTTAVTSVAVGNGVIYAAVYNGNGLMMLECPEARQYDKVRGVAPANASYRAPYETKPNSHFSAWKPADPAPVRGIATWGDYLFAGCSFGGMHILKMAEDGSVSEVANGPMTYAGDVKVKDNRLYVAEGFEGVGIYELGEGAVLNEVGRFNGFDTDGHKPAILWVWVPDDKHIVASSRCSGYYYLDASDPADIKLQGRSGSEVPGWDKYVADKADSRGWYPRFSARHGIYWTNLNYQKINEQKDEGWMPELFDGVVLYKNDRFITATKKSLLIFSSDEIGKQKRGVEGDYWGMPAWDGGTRLCLSCRIHKQISMVDLTDEKHPRIQWVEKTEGYPELALFWNGRLAVPCGYQGLLVEKTKK